MSDDPTPRAADDIPELTGEGLTVRGADVWAEIPARAATLVDDPELITLAYAVVEDGPPPDLAALVHAALADALAQSSSPTVVGECLTVLLESSSALQHLGQRLYDMCLERAQPPAFDAEPRAWLVAADALEAATRLALGDWAPQFALLAQLVRLPPIAPPLFVRAGLRCLAACYERWREPALVAALERLAGVSPAATAAPVDAATAEEWAHDVAPDAAYELGCASLLQALGMDTLPEAEEHLHAAQRHLAIAAADRDDAAILSDVVRLLTAHLPTDAGRAARASIDLAALADRLERRVREHVIGYAELGHWRAPRLDAEVAWAQLAHDVARASTALAQASWYHAEEMLADVLAAYTASRCSRVLRREDQGGVRAILGPTIESGIAVQAGLMKHLEDHIQGLEAADDVDRPGTGDDQSAVPRDADRTAELDAARALLIEARAQLAALDRRPKQRGSAASVSPDGPTALPLLNRLLGQ